MFALGLTGCAANREPETTYSIGGSSKLLTYEQAQAAITLARTKAIQLDGPIQVVKAIPPMYPVDARLMRIEGTVLVELVVDRRGRVASTKVLGEPNQLLADAAVRAVSQWEFRPHTVHGSPVNVVFCQPVAFKLGPR